MSLHGNIVSDDEALNCDSFTFTGQNARFTVICKECEKPRLIYGKSKLNERQKVQLALLLSEYEYSCGSPITTPGHNLHGKLLVRLNIDCSSCMETSYYSANLDRLDICYYCGASGAEIDNDLKKTVQKCISPMYRLWKKGI